MPQESYDLKRRAKEQLNEKWLQAGLVSGHTTNYTGHLSRDIIKGIRKTSEVYLIPLIMPEVDPLCPADLCEKYVVE
ncbi:hypothetical protein UF75_5029 [Desulfosporosinus sp. I2]|uniref:hypothetical protein n=1 Tax=Desulfosporosinus sp. I2 TaxID=1617025 RepID=UPI0005EE907A|nr:hypothetical protein [Desulfosporosinus sp. I2]KJR44600.1 hypothetical protein UF75_5029 [Desulfosporosinus sp. I2]